MKQIVPLAFVMLMATAAVHLSTAVAASAGARAAAADAAAILKSAAAVHVSVTYNGKGAVDARHRVWVWLFDTPDIGPGAMPIAGLSLDTNGSLAAFDGISAAQVWIAAAYDESGTMTGNGPPPSGSPIGLLVGPDGRPQSVAPGSEPVALTFDDSQRMPY